MQPEIHFFNPLRRSLVGLLAATLGLLMPAAADAQNAAGVPRFEVYGSLGAGGVMDDESYRGAGFGARGGFVSYTSPSMFIGADVRVTPTVGSANPRLVTLGQFPCGLCSGWARDRRYGPTRRQRRNWGVQQAP